MKELKINTNNKKDTMISQYDIEKLLDELIAILNGKYKVSSFFVITNNSRSVEILKPKFEYFKYDEKQVNNCKRLWELKIGYIKIIREV